MKNAIATILALSLGLACGAASASSFGGATYGVGASALVVNGMQLPVEAKPKDTSSNLYRSEHTAATEHGGQKVWSRFSLRPFSLSLK